MAAQPTQDFIPFKEVRDGIVVLKDDSLRAILMVSSLNISLKSNEEQEMISLQFQRFLNSLEFSVQFCIESRKLDIRPYIAVLEELEKEQVNELMKIQAREYISFIKSFTEATNIMSKTFFVVIPYTPTIATGVKKKGFLSSLGLGGGKKEADAEKKWLEEFEESRTQLEQRVAVISQELSHMGVRGVQLGTEEIIELFYKVFNPGELEKPVELSQLA